MYDVIFIGGGPAGYNGALRAAELGLKTALVEKAELGGTCLNRGCIPTKSLLKSAEVFETAKNAATFGVNTASVSLDDEGVYRRKGDVVAKLKDGVAFLIKKSGLDYFAADASFLDGHTLKLTSSDGESTIEGKNIVIATGAAPAKLRLEGVEYTLNSDDVLNAPVQGDSVMIIGGGVIGIEFATMLSAFGKSVTVAEMEDRILPLLDKDVAAYLNMTLKKSGVKIVTSAKVLRVTKTPSDKLIAAVEVKGKPTEIEADTVIVSIGRIANIEGLSLQNANVNYERRIIVDKNFKTSADNIYAVGDVSSAVQLAHVAEAQAVYVAELIAGLTPGVDFGVIPSCVYTHPEVAAVGDTSSEAAAYVGKAQMGANGRAVIEDSAVGFVKVAFNGDFVLIGAVIMCPRATDMLAELTVAVKKGLTADDVLNTIHPHPTMSEAVRAAVTAAKKLMPARK